MLNLKKSVLGLAISLALASQFTYAGGSTGGATEVTQIMNNVELLSSVSKQSALVAGQVRDYASQLNQYVTMVENLKQLPQEVINETLAPYKQTLQDLGAIHEAATDVYATTTEGYQTLQRRKAEMERLSLDPSQYLNYEMLLAKTKGGTYKQQAEKDIKALKDVEEKSKKLAGMTDKIEGIKGNVKGMQTLAQLNQMMVGEMMEMNSQIRQKSLEDNTAKEQAKLDEVERKKQEIIDTAERKKTSEATAKSINSGSRYDVLEHRDEVLNRVLK